VIGKVASTRRTTRKIVIQDRSRLFRECLERLLLSNDAGTVAETVPDEASLLKAFGSESFDAVVFEVTGVPWNVTELVQSLEGQPEPPVLIGTYPPGQRHPSLIAGVHLVSRTSSSQAVAYRLAMSSTSEVPEGLENLTLSSGIPDALTRREFQVLALISGGLTTIQIAARLGISGKTVESRRQTLFRKLGVQNQSGAIAVAMETGLLGIGTRPTGDS
jgi:DNA-binding NarL/FixJ family response regulator